LSRAHTFASTKKKTATKKKKKKKPGPYQKYILMGLGVLSLMIIAVALTIFIMKPAGPSGELEKLFFKMEKKIILEDKEKVLIEYIKSNPGGLYIKEVEDKLREIRYLIGAREYDLAVAEVDHLVVSDNLLVEAQDIFNKYLAKYPSGYYVAEINARLKKIPLLIADIQFHKIRGLRSFDIKLKSCRKFLEKYPDSKFTLAVKNTISYLSDITYDTIVKNVPICESEKSWSKCIKLCDKYINNFSNRNKYKEILEIKKTLQGKVDYENLLKKIKNLKADYATSKKVYMRFLKTLSLMLDMRLIKNSSCWINSIRKNWRGKRLLKP